jgi:serine/threonine protein phosphatase PrpC
MTISIVHTMKADGKIWTFKIGGAGCEKKITRTPIELNKDPINIYGFGQDSLGIMKSSNQLIVSLADGHGPKESGTDISYKLHEYLITYIGGMYSSILEMLREKKYDDIKTQITWMFKHVDGIIMNEDGITSKYHSGGSTFTMVHKILDEENGTMYTLNYNVGDSPYFKIDTMKGQIYELTESQNCDNIKCIENYANHCLKKGVEPSNVILGRFNTRAGYKVEWVPPGYIYPYKLELEDGVYKVIENVEVMKHFYENIPEISKQYIGYNGGPQSIRDRPSNMKALSDGKYPTTNYGNTIEGSLQTPITFGDKSSKIKHNFMCEPHINITVEDGETTELIGSDGVVDCLTDDEIIRIFKYKETAGLSMDEFIEFLEKSIDIQAVLGGFNFTPGIDKIPTWDDISYWVIDTEVEIEVEVEVEEDLEYQIGKLEQENIEMMKLAKSIRIELDRLNLIINSL